jgi:hypothetical protein
MSRKSPPPQVIKRFEAEEDPYENGIKV